MSERDPMQTCNEEESVGDSLSIQKVSQVQKQNNVQKKQQMNGIVSRQGQVGAGKKTGRSLTLLRKAAEARSKEQGTNQQLYTHKAVPVTCSTSY